MPKGDLPGEALRLALLYEKEIALRARGYQAIAGLDEAGRGPLAGPVCAAAVVLPVGFPFDILADSKKLKRQQRDAARRVITEKAVAWGVGWATHVEIDRINILQASLLAMRRAFSCLLDTTTDGWPERLETETPFGRPFTPATSIPACLTAVADGTHTPELPVPCTAVVKADDTIPEVMAASILAKTARDMLMEHYAKLHPQYSYERHKGYPTKEHRKLVLQFGPSPIQRLSFKVRGNSL
ncbi:MAG: ribonuclease HII [Clostridiales bacterium]|nr:ribonuclease HII [Clostridiales bacterium]